jgi:hypothetical protein
MAKGERMEAVNLIEYLMYRTNKEIRADNLRKLIKEDFAGVTNKLAKQMGLAHIVLSRLIVESPKRFIGDQLARDIEAAAGKPTGWLDNPHHASETELAEKISRLSERDFAVVVSLLKSLAGDRQD